ncbi:MAG TPA: YafY family protein [Candidatus Dormibacteraeota bacterium]
MDASVGRLLTLLELLQAYRRLSAGEIAERLSVDARTVRRYISGLQQMGIPVEGERGPAGGYRLRPGFRLPPLMFSNDEAIAVVLGLLAVQRLGLVEDTAAVQGAVAKLDRVLPEGLRKRVHALQQVVGLGLPRQVRAGPGAAGNVLELTSAARDRLRVKITYRSGAGEQTERVVDPYGVAFQSGAWYLVGWDHLRSDLRTFRLDRVRSCETTRESFERPAGFDTVEHLQATLATLPYRFLAEIKVDLKVDEARALLPATVGVVVQRDGDVILRVGADDLNWTARFLAGLDCDFTVLSPPSLREALAELSGRLAGNAARTA